MTEQHEFKVRVEFDVEVENDSHIDAAFAGAAWLQDRAREGRLDALVYETQQHGDYRHFTTDLEEIVAISYEGQEGKPTQTLPADNARSHELFNALGTILEEMKQHRPDDLVGAWYRVAGVIEETAFPEIIIEADGTWRCPYCKEEIEFIDDYAEELFGRDYDTQRTSIERVELPDDAEKYVIGGDQPTDWSNLYYQHGICENAVSIPPELNVTFI